MTKRKSLLMSVALTVSLIALLLVVGCLQNAYGDSSNQCDINQCNADQCDKNSDIAQLQKSNACNDQSQIDYSEKKDNRCWRELDDWEKKIEQYRDSITEKPTYEVMGDDVHTWHVNRFDRYTKAFNTMTIHRDKDYQIKYDYRGFFGNKASAPWRRANIQYFYNSDTKELNLIAFDGSEIGYNTYGYGLIFGGDTVFEDNIEYDDDDKCDIAENAKTINIDTKITGLKEWGLQCFEQLDKVDILGQQYDTSELSKVYDHVLRKCGLEKQGDKGVAMDFLNAARLDANALLKDADDWASKTKIVFRQKALGNVIVGTDRRYDFHNMDELKNLCDNTLKNEPKYTINVIANMNFNNQTIEIKENQSVTINLYSHSIYSEDSRTSNNPMFKIHGELNMTGNKGDGHAKVRQVTGSDANVLVYKNGVVNVNDVDFVPAIKSGDTPSDGGFFYFDNVNKNSSISDCNFTGKAKNGGAINVNDYADDGATIFFKSCEFNDCSASSQGGAICNDAKHVNMTFNYTYFRNCSCGDEGGAIASTNNYQSYTFDNSLIKDCKSNKNGGAIYSKSTDSNYTFRNTNISSCYSGDEGGAIASMDNRVKYNFDHSNIDSCVAKYEGGAMYIWSSDCDIKGTQSKDVAPLMSYSQLHNTCSFKNCESQLDCGGAIYTSNATGCGNSVNIDHINFIGNKALQNWGGALDLAGDHNSATNCLFKNNTADCVGGLSAGSAGIAHPHTLTINNCEFDENTATNSSHEFDEYRYTENYSKDCGTNRLFWHNKHYDEKDWVHTGVYPERDPFEIVFV